MSHGLDINKKESQVVRIPFIDETDFRPGQEGSFTKDRFFLNGYFEPLKNPLTQEIEYHFIKRPGIGRSVNLGGAQTGQRIYNWTKTSQIYVVADSKIYGNNGSTDLGVTITSNFGNGIHIGIAETRPGASPAYLGIAAGDALYLIATDNSVIVMNNVSILTSSVANPTIITTSGNHNLNTGNKIIIRNHVGSTPSINDTIFTITKISNTTFSIPVNVTIAGAGGSIGSIPGLRTNHLVYMNSYWFMNTINSQIFNCSPDDPTTWSTLNTITSLMQIGNGIGLAKQSNYLVHFNETHFQLFIDAANPVGSPLANVEQGMQQMGCIDGNTIAFNENVIYWVSNTRSGGLDVFQLIGTTNLQSIGSPTVKRNLEQAFASSETIYRGFILRYAGHTWYVLQISTGGSINKTWLYDQDLKVWYNWSGTSSDLRWPIVDVTQRTIGSSLPIGIHESDGWTYTIDQGFFQDNGINFPVVAQTNPLTFGIMARKFYDRAELVGDKQTGTANVLLSFTDDDFTTFSATRTLDMTQNRMFTRNLSNSRRRAWKVSYTGATAMRLQALEFTIELDVS